MPRLVYFWSGVCISDRHPLKGWKTSFAGAASFSVSCEQTWLGFFMFVNRDFVSHGRFRLFNRWFAGLGSRPAFCHSFHVLGVVVDRTRLTAPGSERLGALTATDA